MPAKYAFYSSVTLGAAGYKHMVKAEGILKYVSEALSEAQLLFPLKMVTIFIIISMGA